jgi:hypothetical protein
MSAFTMIIQEALDSIRDLTNLAIVLLAISLAASLALILSCIGLARIKRLRTNVDALLRSNQHLISAEEKRLLKELRIERIPEKSSQNN